MKTKILIFLLLLSVLSNLSAQNKKRIDGQVFDAATGKTIAGAVVSVSGDNIAVKTDEQGKFSFLVDEHITGVETWYPGYYKDFRQIAKPSGLKIYLLASDKKFHSESFIQPFSGLVNIREKQTVLSSVQKNNISLNTTDPEQAMNQIPGLQIIGKSGMPGEGSYFQVRGINSITANTTPLIVINGVPYMPDMNESGIIGGFSKSAFNAVHAADIENITVLKGSEAALYGSLGSNGVILIETDKAVDLDTKVELISQFGLELNQSRLPVMGVQNYKSYVGNVALSRYDDMASVLDLFPYLIDNPDYFYNYLYNNQTDWQDYIFAPAMSTDNVLKIKGGDAIAKYDLSLGIKNKGGQVKNTDYSKYFARLNSDVNLSRKLSMYSSVSMAYMTFNVMEQGMLEATNPLLAAMKKGPIFSPYQKDKNNNLLPDFAIIRNEDNDLITNNMVSNPLALVNEMTAKEHTYDIQISAGLNYKWSDNLKFRALGGVYYQMSRQNVFVPGITNRTIMPLNNFLAINSVRSAEGHTTNYYYQLGADYHKRIDQENDLSASVNAQIAQNYTEYDAGTGYNTANDFYKTLNNVTSSSRFYFGYNDAWNWMNYNANVRYIYQNQFAFGAALSADASSATGPDASLFQLYPALNFKWMAKNSVLSENDYIDKFDIRTEFVVTGNSRFSSSLSKYHYISKVFRELSGLVRPGIPNTEIKPERNSTFNVGVDATFFRNKLNMTVDYYHTINDNLIMPVSVSSAFGVNYLFDNNAKTRNSGIEASLQYAVVETSKLKWLLQATATANKNSVISLGNQKDLLLEMEDGSALITKPGNSLYAFYGFQTKGVFATTAEASSAGKAGNPLRNAAGSVFGAGDIWFVDQNNDGIIDAKDKVDLGSAAPLLFGNLSSVLQYENLELSVSFNYSLGNKMYNATRRSMESMSDFSNQMISVNRRWTYEGQQTDLPRATFADPMGNSRFSDRWIEDASYLKLKELMLSYHFKKILNGTTVFLAGENLMTLTKYLGTDPETMYSYDASLRGFDYAKIAHPRTYKLGFKIQF